MTKNNTQPETDIEQFIRLFDNDAIKRISVGLEVRSRNVDRDLYKARHIITNHNLNLTAMCIGSQSQYGAFTVSINA